MVKSVMVETSQGELDSSQNKDLKAELAREILQTKKEQDLKDKLGGGYDRALTDSNTAFHTLGITLREGIELNKLRSRQEVIHERRDENISRNNIEPFQIAGNREGGSHLDAGYYERFYQIKPHAAFELLSGEKNKREEIKGKFLAGIRNRSNLNQQQLIALNPNLDYPQIVSEDATSNETNRASFLNTRVKLLELKMSALTDPALDPAVKRLLRWRINESLGDLGIVTSVSESFETISKLRSEIAKGSESNQEDIEKLRSEVSAKDRKVMKYCEFVHGKPSKEVFGMANQQIRSDIIKALEIQGLSPENRKFLETYEKELLILSGGESYDIPNFQEIADKVKPQIEEAYEYLFAGVEFDESKQYSSEEAKIVFDTAIKNMDLPVYEDGSEGWQVLVDPDKSHMSVSQKDRKVYIPAGKTYTAANLKGLVAHELGTHIRRRQLGEGSEKLKLLSMGLHKYEEAEEGIATIVQGIFSGKLPEIPVERHWAISLAVGLDGKPRDFKDVFIEMEKYYRLRVLLGKSKGNSEDLAWDTTVRAFRGTSGMTPGKCNTKDIIYAEGNLKTWRALATNPEMTASFALGKWNHLRDDHIEFLKLIGIDIDNQSEPAT